jgi:hypothetical protein
MMIEMKYLLKLLSMEVVKMMMKPLPVLVDHYHWMIDWFCFVYVVDTKQKIRIGFSSPVSNVTLYVGYCRA